MRASILTVGFVLGAAAAPAAAQYPYPYAPAPFPGNFLPNYYNRTSQPLSPYLNLLRGGNAGVNYYYGVRPGTPAGGMTPFGTPAAPGGPFAPPTQFLPQASVVVDPAAGEPFAPGGQPTTLRPAGHPVLFGNTFNGHGSYYSVYAPTINRGQAGMTAGGQTPAVPGIRQGAAGLGTTPRPAAPPRR